MWRFVLLILIIPSVFAVSVPMTLTVVNPTENRTTVPETRILNDSYTSFPNTSSAVTGAVVYDATEMGHKSLALWLFLALAGILAAILVWRR